MDEIAERRAPTPTPRKPGSNAGCELVEIRPGYPGYRGYVTNLDGVGDHVCLHQIEAQDPSFNQVREDAANRSAAHRIGLVGAPEEWTWENWMAIEAERDLTPRTCYSCAVAGAPSRAEPTGVSVTPGDPRLLLGGFGTAFALSRILDERGLPAWAVDDLFPSDHNLRAFVGMANPRQHWNATQLLAGYGVVVESMTTPGQFPDVAFLARNLINQGGYTPTPASATPDDQVFMVGVGVETLSRFTVPTIGQAVLRRFETAATGWRAELLGDPAAPSFAEWLRSNGGLGV